MPYLEYSAMLSLGKQRTTDAVVAGRLYPASERARVSPDDFLILFPLFIDFAFARFAAVRFFFFTSGYGRIRLPKFPEATAHSVMV